MKLRTLSTLFILALLWWAVPAHAVVDGSCNYTAAKGVANGFVGCNEELAAIIATPDDDVPEAGDFGSLLATSPITQAGGTISTSIATNRLVGRTTAGTGVMEVITPDGTLVLSAGGLGVVDVTCTGCLGSTEIAALDAGDTTTGVFDDARVDGSLEADEVNPTLGTQTQGNFQLTTAAGTGIAVTGADAEGSTKTVAFDYSDAGTDPGLGADQCVFTSNATVPGNIVCEGDVADTLESRIALTAPTVDRTFTVPDADSNAVQPLTCGGTDKVSAISALGVITCTADAGGAGGDSITVEDGDNVGTFTATVDADFEDSGDINFVLTGNDISGLVRADSISGGEIADGSIDGEDLAATVAGSGLTETAGSPDQIDIALHVTGPGLVISGDTLSLIRTCADGEILEYTAASGWACGTDAGGASPFTRVAGDSGAAGADVTLQRLTGDCASNSTTTAAVCMTTTGVGAGVWNFKYLVRYKSGGASVGVGFSVNHTGTTGVFLSNWQFVSTGSVAATGVADQVAAVNPGQMVEGKSERVKNTISSASAGVDLADVDQLAILEGMIVVTVSGDLQFKHASESASPTQVLDDTHLILTKIE